MKHPKHVARGIAEVRNFRTQLFQTMTASFSADGGAIFPIDLVTILVAKRTVSTAAGFASLVEQHNMVCARTLLRTQIDSMLRLYAFTLVDDPHDLAKKILSGVDLGKIHDRNKDQMRDGHLKKLLGKDLPWLEEVYKRTSGFVHLSDELIGLTMGVDEHNDHFKPKCAITETDEMPEASWVEVIECFLETSHVILHLIDTWVETKNTVAAKRAA
jgi:hypothetical protein